MKKSIFPAILILSAMMLGGCSLGSNIASDAKSDNIAVAQQAQKVQDLEAQVKAQKTVADAEKQKLSGLEQQLKGAEQNLKGVKTQSKAQ